MRVVVILLVAVKLSSQCHSKGKSVSNRLALGRRPEKIGPCGVVPITRWLGRPSLRRQRLRTPVGIVVIQHTVFGPCASDLACREVLRYITNFHVKVMKFDDIGNSFFVGATGRVYEGAGWRVGAHTLGYNKRSIGLSFIGDFRYVLPTPEALEAAREFISCAVSRGYMKRNYQLIGHSQLTRTESPGAYLQNLIRYWPHFTSKPK